MGEIMILRIWKSFIPAFCHNMTVCYFYGVAVPRHQSASHHIGFSQACPARLGKQHFPANHLLRRKEAVIWLLLGPQVNTLVSLVFSKLWEGEERNLICKGQMEQWKLFPPKDNFGHFYSINFSYLVLIFFRHMPKICKKRKEIESIKIASKATLEHSESLYQILRRWWSTGLATLGSLVGLWAGGCLISGLMGPTWPPRHLHPGQLHLHLAIMGPT